MRRPVRETGAGAGARSGCGLAGLRARCAPAGVAPVALLIALWAVAELAVVLAFVVALGRPA